MRLSATKALLERRDVVIVATVSAIYGLGDPGAYSRMVLHLVARRRIDQRKILRRLTELQYTRNELDLAPRHLPRARRRDRRVPGRVGARGAAHRAVRRRDREISLFDPLTGEVLRNLAARHDLPEDPLRDAARDAAGGGRAHPRRARRACSSALRDANKLLEAQRLEQRTRFDIEMISELGYCNGIENYSRYLSGRQPGEPPPSLFDYLPDDALLFVDESHVTIPQIGGMYRGDRSRKETLVEYGFRLPSALDNRPLRFEEWERLAPQTIFVSATPGPYELQHSEQIVEQVVRPTGLVDPDVEVRPARTQVDDVLSEITRASQPASAC